MPTQIVFECLCVLLPALTKRISLSLESGCFPESWEHADVCPRLKKPKSDASFPNLHPISNLTFVSKLTEFANSELSLHQSLVFLPGISQYWNRTTSNQNR